MINYPPVKRGNIDYSLSVRLYGRVYTIYLQKYSVEIYITSHTDRALIEDVQHYTFV